MKGLKIYAVTLILLTVINMVNRLLVWRKNKSLQGYDRQEAFALDVFACWNYRTFWDRYLTDGSPDAYWPTDYGETISSALGENLLRGTASGPGRGLLSRWFHGQGLSRHLDRAFGEVNHCIEARKAFLKKKK